MTEQFKHWFRRDSFYMAPNNQPKWHYLEKRVPTDPVKHPDSLSTWVAVCGYKRSFILETPMLRANVKTKSLRCVKCSKKLEEAGAKADREMNEVMPQLRKLMS